MTKSAENSDEGHVTLRFDKTTVQRLWEHARSAPKSLPAYGEKNADPALWLVGDRGIYLMSNGEPAISFAGEIMDPRLAEGVPRLVAYAEGCHPEDDRKHWRPIHSSIANGDDFTITISLADIGQALESAETEIVFAIDRPSLTAMSDVAYRRH